MDLEHWLQIGFQAPGGLVSPVLTPVVSGGLQAVSVVRQFSDVLVQSLQIHVIYCLTMLDVRHFLCA